MSVRITSSGGRWDFPFPQSQAQEVLARVCRAGACHVTLISESGEEALSVINDACAERQCDAAVERASLIIGGAERGLLVAATHDPTERLELTQRLQLATAWLADVWQVADELDSLSEEVVHAYEELHLLYQIGEELTGQMGSTQTAEFIVTQTLPTFAAARIELRLDGLDLPLCTRLRSPDVVLPPADAENRTIQVPLRAGGSVIGMLEVQRSMSDEPFSSRHGKLLVAVSSLAGSAIRNAQLYEEVQQREAYLATVLDNVAEGILTIGDGGLITSCNRAAERLLGYPQSDVIGTSIVSLLAAPHDERMKEHLARWLEDGSIGNWGEVLGVRSDNSIIPLDVVASEMVLATQRRLIISLRDASERKQAEAVLRHQALHDALTDLPNRSLLRDRLDQAVRTAHRFGTPLSLLMMDLDRFKEVNDTFGHHFGDLLLQAVARRLTDEIRGSDTIARLGGDEFAVLLPTADENSARNVAERLVKVLEQPVEIHGQLVHVGISIGLAVSPKHGTDPEALMRHADVAMYASKRDGLGVAIYEPDQDTHSPLRLTLLSNLREAINHDELVMHYQPKVPFHGVKTPCVEALVRWQHPQQGLLAPSHFLPLAEQTGLIRPLGEWVLNAVLRQCRLWRDNGLELSVAVNLSARNLQDSLLPNRIASLLRRWDVPGASLTVELTESSLMDHPEHAIEVLTRLREMGVGVSVDDFGTGYSSLSYLKRLPVSELKIDRTFIKDVATDENDAAIVRSTISLGHDLGLTVVAEGIEDRPSWNYLNALGCDVAQGFFIARPMPAPDFERWFAMEVSSQSSELAIAS